MDNRYPFHSLTQLASPPLTSLFFFFLKSLTTCKSAHFDSLRCHIACSSISPRYISSKFGGVADRVVQYLQRHPSTLACVDVGASEFEVSRPQLFASFGCTLKKPDIFLGGLCRPRQDCHNVARTCYSCLCSSESLKWRCTTFGPRAQKSGRQHCWTFINVVLVASCRCTPHCQGSLSRTGGSAQGHSPGT